MERFFESARSLYSVGRRRITVWHRAPGTVRASQPFRLEVFTRKCSRVRHEVFTRRHIENLAHDMPLTLQAFLTPLRRQCASSDGDEESSSSSSPSLIACALLLMGGAAAASILAAPDVGASPDGWGALATAAATAIWKDNTTLRSPPPPPLFARLRRCAAYDRDPQGCAAARFGQEPCQHASGKCRSTAWWSGNRSSTRRPGTRGKQTSSVRLKKAAPALARARNKTKWSRPHGRRLLADVRTREGGLSAPGRALHRVSAPSSAETPQLERDILQVLCHGQPLLTALNSTPANVAQVSPARDSR